jgi:hypothetical protein
MHGRLPCSVQLCSKVPYEQRLLRPRIGWRIRGGGIRIVRLEF